MVMNTRIKSSRLDKLQSIHHASHITVLQCLGQLEAFIMDGKMSLLADSPPESVLCVYYMNTLN